MNLNCSNDPKTSESYKLGDAARRDLVPLITRTHTSVTEEWLQTNLADQGQLVGLHWECGGGEDSLLIANMLPMESRLLCLDADSVLLEKARVQKWKPTEDGVRFGSCVELFEAEDKAFDFIYTRAWRFERAQQAPLLQAFSRKLKPGGMLLIEVMQLAGYQIYPYNHAFSRAAELIGLLEDVSQDASAEWTEQLNMEGFEVVLATYAPSAFIDSTSNGIIALALEGFSKEIIRQQHASKEEINALLQEIKLCEQDGHTLISRPGVWQYATIKTQH